MQAKTARMLFPDLLAGRARPVTPPAAWLLSLLLAVLGGAGVADPKLGVGVAGLVIFAGLGAAVLARPVVGFLLVLWIFPFYTLARSVIELYHIPIPLALLGMWPELVLSVMFVGSVIAAIRRRERLPVAWDDLPVLVLLLAGVYGIALSLAEGEPVLAVYGLHASVSTLLFYVAARWMRPSPDDLRQVVRAFLLSYAVLAVLSLLDYVFRPHLMIELAALQRRSMLVGRDPHLFYSWYPRMQSLLFGEGIWGSLSALASLLCLALMTTGTTRAVTRWGLSISALFGLSMVCLGLTLSRGAFLCWLAGLLALLLIGGHRRLRVVGPIVLIVALMAGGVYWRMRDTPLADYFLARADALVNRDNPLAQDRKGEWKWALDRFRLVPAGMGLGRAGIVSNTHGGTSSADTIFDGGYFRVLAEQGIPGILALLTGITGLLWVLLRQLRGARGLEKAVGLAVTAYLCGIAVQNAGHNAFDFLYPTAVLWTLVGLYVARRHAGKPSPDAAP